MHFRAAREYIDDALHNLSMATGLKRSHVDVAAAVVAAAVVMMLLFVAGGHTWRSAALLCAGPFYPILLLVRQIITGPSEREVAVWKNYFLYVLLASLHQLLPICWWVPFNVQFAVTLFLVHFEGAATLFDWFLKAYFEPAEACTALVKTARKVRRRVSCRFSLTPPRRS